MAMGLIGKLLAAKAVKSVVDASRNSAAREGAVQATGAQAGSMASQAPAMLGYAGRFYRNNTKLVHTVGSAALAIALARMLQKRRA
jgi:hypothetical protein